MDLTTKYLGLTLRNPLLASAGPMTQSVSGIRRLAEAGIGAVVLPSLFEEQVRRGSTQETPPPEDDPDALAYLPTIGGEAGPRRYMSMIERAAAAVDIPVIASLNGVTTGGWTDHATAMEQAGAAAIELNIYYLPDDPFTPGRDVEQRHIEILTTVKAAVSIPVAVKLGPYFSSAGEIAARLDRVGADGLVLFNRFMQTDIDPETMTVTTGVRLSSPVESGPPRSWIARLRGRVRASLAASTGVESPADVAAYLLAGADVVMTTSSLLRHGYGHATVLLDGLRSWMERKSFASVDDLRGMLAVPAEADGSDYGRGGYLHAIEEATRNFGPR
jgi:dihydroorotate dehydrogenase (fumarate)